MVVERRGRSSGSCAAHASSRRPSISRCCSWSSPVRGEQRGPEPLRAVPGRPDHLRQPGGSAGVIEGEVEVGVRPHRRQDVARLAGVVEPRQVVARGLDLRRRRTVRRPGAPRATPAPGAPRTDRAGRRRRSRAPARPGAGRAWRARAPPAGGRPPGSARCSCRATARARRGGAASRACSSPRMIASRSSSRAYSAIVRCRIRPASVARARGISRKTVPRA